MKPHSDYKKSSKRQFTNIEDDAKTGVVCKKRVIEVEDGSGMGIADTYLFKVLLPNGVSVGLTVRNPKPQMNVNVFIALVKEEYFQAKQESPSMKQKRTIRWKSEDLYLEDTSDNQIRDWIKFKNFKPHTCHILRLHDGSAHSDTFENMWDLTPDTDLLMELPEVYNFETALADLIDNSLQAVWGNPNGRRLISVDIADDKITIFDTGSGMDGTDENSIVKWGKMGASLHRISKNQAIGGKPPYLKPFFGLFGYGGPIATMHLGRRALVSSKTVDSKKVYVLHLKREALLKNSGSQFTWRTDGGMRSPLEDEIARSPEGSFTKVEIFEPRKRDVNVYELQCKLKDIYFPYIQSDEVSKHGKTYRPIEFQVDGADLAEIEGGEFAVTNLHSCNGPDFVIQVHFSISQRTMASKSPGSTTATEANARLKCVYFPIVQGKEHIGRILEKLEAVGWGVAENYETFSRVSIRRLGRLLPDARWVRLPFMEPKSVRGDKAHLLKRCYSRAKCFIDTDAGFYPTPSKTDLAQHNPFNSALKDLGRSSAVEKEVNVEIYRQGKLLTPQQLEKEYHHWILQMHNQYDEETDGGEDEPVFLINPPNKKALGITSDVVRVHQVMKRKGKSWQNGQKIKILKGAYAGFHNNNVYGTLEYFLVEGLQGEAGGEARVICRPLLVAEEDACKLSNIDENPSLDIQNSRSLPIGVIDSGKLVPIEESEWESQLEKQRQKLPPTIELLGPEDCEELKIDGALPDGSISAGHDPPRELVAVLRPASFTSSASSSSKLVPKFIIRDDIEMTMQIKFIDNVGNSQDDHIYSSRLAPSSREGLHGLYIFTLGSKCPNLFRKAGIYRFMFSINEKICKSCERTVTVTVSPDVDEWKLLAYDQNKCSTIIVGSCFPRLSVACYDRYKNRAQFTSNEDIMLKLVTGSVSTCVNKFRADISLDKRTLIVEDIIIESTELDLIRPTYTARLVIARQNESISVSIPCQVFPGHPHHVLAQPPVLKDEIVPGSVIDELKLEMFDAYDNHVRKDTEVTLVLDGLWLEDEMGLKRKVDGTGFIDLSGILKVVANYGRRVWLSILYEGKRIFSIGTQTTEREITVESPAVDVLLASPLENDTPRLCMDEDVVETQGLSTPVNAENLFSIFNIKVLENDIHEMGLCIKNYEKGLNILNERKDDIEQFMMDLQDVKEPSALELDCLFLKEDIMERIESKDQSAASIICKLSRKMFSEENMVLMDDVIGIVALLGTVSTVQLSRILAKYLGEDQMLAVVCRSYDAACCLEKYEPNGEVDQRSALHAKAAELGVSINGQFHVMCLDNIMPYDGDFYGHGSERKLELPGPILPTGETPRGFLGHAVNMIDVETDHSAMQAGKRGGLRETLFYRLFGELQVYDTRENMKAALMSIKHGAVSLDGGVLRENGLISLGCWESEICFPVVPESQPCGSTEMPENTKQLEDKKKELRSTLRCIKEVERRYGECMKTFNEKVQKLNERYDILESLTKPTGS